MRGIPRPIEVREKISQTLRGRKFSASTRAKISAAMRRHGQSASNRTPTYISWISMHQRCSNPKSPDYKRYGARGISVCLRWDKFELFLQDMGRRPEGKTLGRINSDGNYEPGNCEWQTYAEQTRNQKRMKLSEAQVMEIRRLYAVGGIYQRQLATMFGVGQVQISRIVRGELWNLSGGM